jgi:hypothetical protein
MAAVGAAAGKRLEIDIGHPAKNAAILLRFVFAGRGAEPRA